MGEFARFLGGQNKGRCTDELIQIREKQISNNGVVRFS